MGKGSQVMPCKTMHINRRKLTKAQGEEPEEELREEWSKAVQCGASKK